MRLAISAVAVLVALSAAGAAQAKVITYCSEAVPEGFDPAPFVTPATFDASSQVFYDRLVDFKPGTTQVIPSLAESWDVSADGRQYTFHLRGGVKFHSTAYFTPSRELNADDVLFSLNRQRDKKNAWYNYAGGAWPYYSALGLDSLIKSIDKVDAGTVRVTLTRPDAGLLADLAMDFASILSKEYADGLAKAKTAELLNVLPVGTGPFQYVSYTTGRGLLMAGNRDYWRGMAKVSTLNFLPTPDPAQRLAKLKDGTCQVMGAPDAAAVQAAQTDPALTYAATERADVSFVAFNSTEPAFKDPRVRKALGMAIDRQAIVSSVYGGAAVAANSVMPRSMWGYDGSITGDFYSVDGAKALLTQAGVIGLKVKLLATTTPRPYNPDLGETASMVAADLAKVGVEATVVTPDLLGDFLRQSIDKKRDGGVVIGWTSDNGDPDNFLSLLFSCEAVGQSNRAEWCDPEFSKLLAQARVAADPAVRARLYSEAQRIIIDQSPLTAIAHSMVVVPMRKEVTGVLADPLGRHNFVSADIAG